MYLKVLIDKRQCTYYQGPPRAVQSFKTDNLSIPMGCVVSICLGIGRSSKLPSRFPSRIPFESGLETESFRTILVQSISVMREEYVSSSSENAPEGFGIQSSNMLHVSRQGALKEL